MARAKSNGFLFDYIEKVVVVVLIIACGLYVFFTFRSVAPKSLEELDTVLEELRAKKSLRPLTHGERLDTGEIVDFLDGPLQIAKLAKDPFQMPSHIRLPKLLTIKPGTSQSVRVRQIVAEGLKVKDVIIKPGSHPDLRIVPTIIENGTQVNIAALDPNPTVQGEADIVLVDVSDNTLTISVSVTTKIVQAFPPKLVSLTPERGRVSIEWEEDPRTNASIMGWVIERSFEGRDFHTVERIVRSVDTEVESDDEREISKPSKDEYNFTDEKDVLASMTYKYRVSTLYEGAGAEPDQTGPSNVMEVSTLSDLRIVLTGIGPTLATVQVIKWVEDVEVAQDFQVQKGERIGYNTHRTYPNIEGEVDFTTPWILLDIQPTRVLKEMEKPVSEVDEHGRVTVRQVKVVYQQKGYQIIVYNEERDTRDVLRVQR